MTALAELRQAVPLCAVDELHVCQDLELTATKTISATDPYLSGHYPGRPIYPGVFVIESVLQAARRYLGEQALAVAAVESVRLNAPLLPGDTMRITLSFNRLPDEQVRVRARCARADGSLAASVDLRCVGLARRYTLAADGEPAGVLCTGAWHGNLPDVHDLLPHRPPILLVDEIREYAPGMAVAEYVVRDTEPCYAGGDLGVTCYPDTLVLESFVQAAAALFVLERGDLHGRTLVLGSARGVRFGEPVLAGEVISHRVHLDRLTGDTALLRGASSVHGRACLEVTSVVLAARAGLAEPGIAR
ncbi:MAG TPA: hypothetical protein VGM75_33970 [Pseudonocardiaceae bacterium]